MIEDRQLSPHFSLYELTTTVHQEFQEQNRILTEDQATKLLVLANLLEEVRLILDVPMKVTSGYRCPALNVKVGSTLRSQHLLCEAADFYPKDMARDEAFKILRHAVKDKKLHVGQLIWEKSNREGLKEWIHVSLGAPYRELHRTGQILTMVDGQYTLIETA